MADKSRTTTTAPGLLPAGLGDLMPDQARHEARAIASLMESLALFGYAPVKPPLVEFEETILADGPGAALAPDSFRLLDPQSSRMMALRADMTAQIARIASTRMAHLPRPLRLSYNGAVLRVKAEPLNPERQLTQVGAEMIGAASPAHDAEVAVAALTALGRAGVAKMTIDLGIPRLLDAVHGGNGAPTGLVDAVNAKNHSLVRKLAGKDAKSIALLMDVPLGGVEAIEKGLKGPLSKLPKPAVAMLKELVEAAGRIGEAMPGASVTVDPLEQRGFDYHHGIGFAIFAPGIRGELGRGGRYRTATAEGRGEESTGVTLYLERVLRATPAPESPDMVYVPFRAGMGAVVDLVGQGRAALLGTSGGGPKAQRGEALALGCSHWLVDGAVKALAD